MVAPRGAEDFFPVQIVGVPKTQVKVAAQACISIYWVASKPFQQVFLLILSLQLNIQSLIREARPIVSAPMLGILPLNGHCDR
jgi:hypothetical protein